MQVRKADQETSVVLTTLGPGQRRTSHEPNLITVWVDPNYFKFACWVKRPNLIQPNSKKHAIPVFLLTHTLT